MVDQPSSQDTLVAHNLVNITLLEVVLSRLGDDLDEVEVYGFKLGIIHNVRIDKQIVEVEVTATIVNGDSEDELAKIRVGFGYLFQNLDKIDLDGGRLLPRHLADMLNSISISTTRGILFSELRGTKLQKLILPIVSPQNLNRAHPPGM